MVNKRGEREKKVREYLQNEVDPYIRPLLMELMKVQPPNVYEYLQYWVSSPAKVIHEKKQAEKHNSKKSVHYENIKEIMVEMGHEEEEEQEQEEREMNTQPIHHDIVEEEMSVSKKEDDSHHSEEQNVESHTQVIKKTTIIQTTNIDVHGNEHVIETEAPIKTVEITEVHKIVKTYSENDLNKSNEHEVKESFAQHSEVQEPVSHHSEVEHIDPHHSEPNESEIEVKESHLVVEESFKESHHEESVKESQNKTIEDVHEQDVEFNAESKKESEEHH